MQGELSRYRLARRLALTALGLGWFVLNLGTMPCQAQNIKGLFGKRTKSPNQTNFELTEKAGPWLIMCTSFVGESAEEEAIRLCQELNQKLKLPCYYYAHTFDFSDDYEGLYYSADVDIENAERDSNGQVIPKRRKTKTVHGIDIMEVAVLVGDFPTVDDARCQRILEQVKHIPNLESANAEEKVHRPLMVHRELAKAISENRDMKSKGPLGSAFVMANPLVPEEMIAASKIDYTILNLNKGIDNSLLECPGAYSIRVATFSGFSTFATDEIEAENKKFLGLKRLGKPISQSKLAEASEKAHILCAELRKLGAEAYEFHDRAESYVCVGSYDWISKKDLSGNAYLNPEVVKMIELFKGSVEDLPNSPHAFVAKSLPQLSKKGIAFDVQPMPVAVPKVPGTQPVRSANLDTSIRR